MKVYDSDEEVTFYFVIFKYKDVNNIQAWTDSKELAKVYMEFHSSKSLKLKSITGEYSSVIVPILNEAANDEIQLANIIIRDQKNRNKYEQITVPLTQTESIFVNSEESTYMGSRIDYTVLNKMTPFLKNKWRRVLNMIHLDDVINQSIHMRSSKFTMNTRLDQLSLLVRSFPDYFGI